MKRKKFIILIILILILIPINVLADTSSVTDAILSQEELAQNNLCNTEALGSVRLIGIAIFVAKIIIPIIIVGFAAVDFMKAILSADDKDISKGFANLLKRFIAGVLIFFAPAIISVILESVPGVSDINEEYNKCTECMFNPYSDKCQEYIQNIE